MIRQSRAGLDYWKDVDLTIWESYTKILWRLTKGARIFYATTKTQNKYSDVNLRMIFVMFGPESKGIAEILNQNKDFCITIPMIDMGRSLNLSNSAAIILYETLRQNNFKILGGK